MPTTSRDHIRNLAVIAHVDHGKTTLLDAMLRQGGVFRDHQEVQDRVMDSMDLERERGITILAKNTAIDFRGTRLNIVDTPGHSDFGGEVERALHMVDGALLLVDSSEGPLPQTRFVLLKALAARLPLVLVVNKIDRADARVEEVISEVYDLLIDLGATDEQIELPVLLTDARRGVAHRRLDDGSESLLPLFETILEAIPAPRGDLEAPPRFLVTNLDYDPYLGQLALGRLLDGVLETGRTYAQAREDGSLCRFRLSALLGFQGLTRVKVPRAEAGEIVMLAGMDEVRIGDTITDPDNPVIEPRIYVDEPTVSMVFMVNDGPFAGREGSRVTSRQIKDRLENEVRRNVALELRPTDRADAIEVCGRGELQLAVLLETMRREGFELLVSRPRVIEREENGQRLEPFERIHLDLQEDYVGVVTEKLSLRRSRMVNLVNTGSGRARLEFICPSRALIGFRGEFLTDTRGTGVINSQLEGYGPWAGEIPRRKSGAMVADRPGRVTAYASYSLEERGEIFVSPGDEVYQGMIVGERNRAGDLDVNIVREKKLTNMRSATADTFVTLRPPRRMGLEAAIEFIADDELVEITPQAVRLRKRTLDPSRREVERKRARSEAG
ncbi:MAG: translational GTPase TypA [Acidobacteriota bacterium]|nr:translational GTPase TypA [Acidobacteriota bacterium]MDQ7086978.1 translational GTPase TypA [Acidobacteriota bacterium]